jgi:4-hydroxybenzoate polyprenyltransferase
MIVVGEPMKISIGGLVRLARPEHWVKNVVVLFPVVFALKVGDATAWLRAGLATVAFCLASSSVYVVNDIRDRDSDRLHPRKKNRPLTSGQVGVGQALVEAAVLLLAAVAVAWGVSALTLLIIVGYVLLQTAYTLALKAKMIVDVMCIATGFVLRAAAGGVAIRVELSPWLFICAFTICLFMGFCKRRSEAAVIGDGELAAQHRRTLPNYTPPLLTHLTTLSAAIAIVSYLLYASSSRTVEHFGTIYLIYTVPIVIYGICRFEMLSALGIYADPTEVMLRDRPFQATLIAWAAAVAAVIWWGRPFQEWLKSYY